MTHFRYISRCKVERYAKLCAYISVNITFALGYYFSFNGYLIAVISTFLWFYSPDIFAYILEEIYHTGHKKDTYR